MNLREDKHWAYGAHSFLQNAVAQRPFLMYAPVQTDKTAPSVAEILKEAKGVIGDKPLTNEEISRVKVGDVRSMPASIRLLPRSWARCRALPCTTDPMTMCKP